MGNDGAAGAWANGAGEGVGAGPNGLGPEPGAAGLGVDAGGWKGCCGRGIPAGPLGAGAAGAIGCWGARENGDGIFCPGTE